MESLQKGSLLLTIIGGLNWGLIGFFNFNLVTTLFGNNTTLTSIVYALVGIASIINIGILFMHLEETK